MGGRGAIERLNKFIRSHPLVGFDTMVLIYHFENHPRYAPISEAFLKCLERGETGGVTSVVTLAESLVRPLQSGETEIALSYLRFLTLSPHVRLVPILASSAIGAAMLRSRYGMRLADALQLAAVLEAGATGFLSNDRRLEVVPEIEVLVLDDCLPSDTSPGHHSSHTEGEAI